MWDLIFHDFGAILVIKFVNLLIFIHFCVSLFFFKKNVLMVYSNS